MTNREFFVAIASNSNLDGALTSKAIEMIDALDRKNTKAQAKRAEKSASNAPLLDEVRAYLGEHKGALAKEIADALGVTTSKAVALAAKLVESGEVEVEKHKVAKIGVRNLYSLAEHDDDAQYLDREVEA